MDARLLEMVASRPCSMLTSCDEDDEGMLALQTVEIPTEQASNLALEVLNLFRCLVTFYSSSCSKQMISKCRLLLVEYPPRPIYSHCTMYGQGHNHLSK